MELLRCWCLFTVLIAGFACSSEAYKFYVGGRDGWTLHPAEGYNHWAGRMRFSVHDSLIFKYENGTDSVLVVNEEDYQKCSLQNPISKMEGGDSVFIFDRSGPFFFISGDQNGTNCNQGQKLHIIVLAIRPPPPSPLSPILPPSIAPAHAPVPVLAPTPSSPSPAIAPAMPPMSPGYTPSITPMTPESSSPGPSPSSNSPLVPGPTSSGNSPPANNPPPPAAAAPAPGKSGASIIGASPSVLAVAGVSVVLSLAFGSLRNVL